MHLKAEDFEKRYTEMTNRIICSCEAATPIVGGVTASDEGVKAFIRHHLKIDDPVEAQRTFDRIKREEIGMKSIAPETGELAEQLTYGINIIRRTESGPYLGSWMIHANLKTSMSRLAIFSELRGSKGDVAEAGIVSPYGISLKDESNWHGLPGKRPIYLIDPVTEGPAETYFEEFKGRVSTPKGSASIIHHSECVPPGTRFEFEFRYLRGKLSQNDIVDVLALSQIVGLGSVKALGSGKFRYLDVEILEAEKPRESKAARERKKVDESKKVEKVEVEEVQERSKEAEELMVEVER